MKYKNLLSIKDFSLLQTSKDVLNEELNEKEELLFNERLEFFEKYKKSELVLGIEGKFTNLRIWISDGYVYMRLDRANQYSVPLSVDKVSYLEKDHPIIQKLAEEYGFKTSIDNLETIIKLTIKMKQRDLVEW